MQRIIYLDHAATTAVNEEVLKEVLPYFSQDYGNASSAYILGRKSKRALTEAREKVAKAINAKPNEIYFTSGGSESDNLALKGIAHSLKNKGNHIITSKIEHHAILNTCETLKKEGFKVSYINVDEVGFIKIDELIKSITKDTILISIMFANNEIGTIEPIELIGKIARENKILFHTDAVQAIGNVKIDVEKMNIDLLSMSGHKFYAPKGTGALYVRENIDFERQIDGGHQEREKRSGTENIPGIIGIGKAIDLAYKNFDINNQKILTLRNYCIEKIKENIKGIKINGDLNKRLPGNINISFKGIEGEDLLFKLDNVGICASTGSACSTGDSKPSHVLTAIGLNPEYERGTLRITLGNENTKDDIDYLVLNLIRIVNELRNSV